MDPTQKPKPAGKAPKTPSPKHGAHTTSGQMLPVIEKRTGVSGGGKNAKGGTDHVPRKERM